MVRPAFALLLFLAAPAALSGCLLLPVRTAPGVEGRVFDAASRKPLAGALVVVRFDGRHGDLLPDREHLGHAEVRTDAAGHFEVARRFEPGVAVYPFFEGEARVVSVLHEGYRCARPRAAVAGAPVEIALTPALDTADQRESCRPVAARKGEAAAYRAAWRALFDDHSADLVQEDQERLEQLLAARSALGFGENCEGPALDLALSPHGDRAAVAVREGKGTAAHVTELGPTGPGKLLRAGAAQRVPPRRLAWTSPQLLVLWEPTSEPLRAASSSLFAEGRVEVLWRAPRAPARAAAPRPAPPAAPAPAAAPGAPLDPEDIHDEGASRWTGRGFTLVRSLDPATGLARDHLRVADTDGSHREIELPGEACGPTGDFGRPHYRIAADGNHAVDLRYTGGGCRAVWIDLESGKWSAFDGAGKQRGICRSERRIPPDHLGVALRGYLRQVEESLESAGSDPTHAYVLRIDPSGRTEAETRDASGASRVVRVANFPVSTPLQLVHVSNLATLDALDGRARARATAPARVPVSGRSVPPAPARPNAPGTPTPEPL